MRQLLGVALTLLLPVPGFALEAGTVFHDSLTNGQQGPELVALPAGSFVLGDRKSVV